MTLEEIKKKLELWLKTENALILVIQELRNAQDLNRILSLTNEAKNLIRMREGTQKAYLDAVHSWNSGL